MFPVAVEDDSVALHASFDTSGGQALEGDALGGFVGFPGRIWRHESSVESRERPQNEAGRFDDDGLARLPGDTGHAAIN
jgi:hypothetical protein